MQVQSNSPYNYSTAQHPYNPNMFASTSTSAPQQYIPEQQQQQQPQQQQQEQGSEDMFFALERLLMGISPFPPTLPTLAKPTCPSLDDQLLAQIASPSAVPSIILNEQSLDLLNQYYQNQDNSNNNNNSQFQQQYSEPSDCSSSARSVSPPSSPFSYAAASPSMPLQSNHWMVAQQQQQQQQTQQDWDFSLFDPMSLPMNMPSGLDYYLAAPQSTMASASLQPLQSTMAAKPLTKKHAHHRRSSSSCSALSAYESTAQREHRASSISSVCSGASSTTTTTTSGGRAVKSYACNMCTKPFPTRTQLKSHMAIHTDAFPFPCQVAGCELHFKRKHDLRRHVDAKHALVKKYLCTGGCGEGFGRRDQMVRHLRRGTCGQGGFQTD